MTTTETSNTDFARTVLIWPMADTLRSLTPRSLKRSEDCLKSETSERRRS